MSACKNKELAAKYGSTPIDEELTASIGDTVTIELGANPSTGYKWEISYNSNEKAVVFIEKIADMDTSGKIGAGGKMYWKFLAKKEGEAKIVMEYKRGDEINKTETFNIKCK